MEQVRLGAVRIGAAEPPFVDHLDALERGHRRQAVVERDHPLGVQAAGEHCVQHVLVGVEQRVAGIVVAEVGAPVVDPGLAVLDQLEDGLALLPPERDEARAQVGAALQRRQVEQLRPFVDEPVGVVLERDHPALAGVGDQRPQRAGHDDVGVDQDHRLRRPGERQDRLERERLPALRRGDERDVRGEQLAPGRGQAAVHHVDRLVVALQAQRVDHPDRAQEVGVARDAVERHRRRRAAAHRRLPSPGLALCDIEWKSSTGVRGRASRAATRPPRARPPGGPASRRNRPSAACPPPRPRTGRSPRPRSGRARTGPGSRSRAAPAATGRPRRSRR